MPFFLTLITLPLISQFKLGDCLSSTFGGQWALIFYHNPAVSNESAFLPAISFVYVISIEVTEYEAHLWFTYFRFGHVVSDCFISFNVSVCKWECFGLARWSVQPTFNHNFKPHVCCLLFYYVLKVLDFSECVGQIRWQVAFA